MIPGCCGKTAAPHSTMKEKGGEPLKMNGQAFREQLRKKPDHGARVLTVFFLVVILVGTILLCLPVASRNGRSCGVLTAAFTATSATCVTGLSLVDTYTQWSFPGQVILLCLIQIGGLGYMTIVSLLIFALRRRIGLRERLIIQQAMALNEMSGVVRLVRLMVQGTFLVEGAGAMVLFVRFSGTYPVKKALWLGIFHAVSAFCNAGFDLMGFLEPGSSLMAFSTDPVVCLTVIALVTIGSLGFFVWNDLLMYRKGRGLSIHTRLVLRISGGLLLGGAVAIAWAEWNNPQTLGTLDFWEKWLCALFQSCTTRTAGFYALPQGGLTGSGKLISILLMLVGGSSGSTAGGIKTVTVAVLMLEAWRVLRNRRDVVVFRRRISQEQISGALCIALLVTLLGVTSGVILSTIQQVPLGDALYETISAVCTVGLSTGITAGLGLGFKIMLMVLMFFGRVGIMTVGFAFMTKRPPDNAIRRPEVRVLIG